MDDRRLSEEWSTIHLSEKQVSSIMTKLQEATDTPGARTGNRKSTLLKSMSIGIVGALACATVLFGISRSITPPVKHPVTSHVPQYSLMDNMENLLEHYGWEPLGSGVMHQTLTLPSTFTVQSGHYPLAMYWAYHNVLSKEDGMDLSPYLGKSVTVYMIPVQQWNPHITGYNADSRQTYGIVVVDQKKIIGAWINQGINLSDFSTSLNKIYFPEIVHETFGQWLKNAGIVNYSAVKNQINWSPQQVIEAYFDDINQGNLAAAYGLTSMSSQYNSFSLNVPSGKLISPSFDPGGISNIRSAHVIAVGTQRPFPPGTPDALDNMLFDRRPYKTMQITATVDVTYKKIIVNNNGTVTWTVSLSKDTKNAPWRIDGMGVG